MRHSPINQVLRDARRRRDARLAPYVDEALAAAVETPESDDDEPNTLSFVQVSE